MNCTNNKKSCKIKMKELNSRKNKGKLINLSRSKSKSSVCQLISQSIFNRISLANLKLKNILVMQIKPVKQICLMMLEAKLTQVKMIWF